MKMNREELLSQYELIRSLTPNPDIWLDSTIGSDLWVDGLNIFLSVETEDFLEAFDAFHTNYYKHSSSMLETIQAFSHFCLDMAQHGEFQLYQALSVGMTWLTLQPETNGQFFNTQVFVTNHSAAILLSPTYQAVWAQSFCSGLELAIDLEENRNTIFRPEHGRIYQKGTWHQSGQTIRYPYQHFFHEMAHILLFNDLYARVIGKNADEDTSYFVHMEAVITCLEEVVLAELMAVRSDLNLIDDAFGNIQNYPEASAFRMDVHQGNVEGVTPEILWLYLKQHFQLGEGERSIPDNLIKEIIVERHVVSENISRVIEPHYHRLVFNLQGHSYWGKQASNRNRLPEYREIVELLPLDSFAVKMLEQSLSPEFWADLAGQLAFEEEKEDWIRLRELNRDRWRWWERVMRIAEMRGYLAIQGLGHEEISVLERLSQIAKRIANHLDHDNSVGYSEAQFLEEIRRCLFDVKNEEHRVKLLQMVDEPFSYLLEPR